MKQVGAQFRTGFTIVELLIVIVVIAILAAISLVAYNNIQNRAHDTAVTTDLTNAMKKLRLYQPSNDDKFPTTVAQLPDVGIRANKNSYLTTGTTYNFVICVIADGSAVSLSAISRSGKRLYISSNVGGVKEFTGATDWVGSTGYTAMCNDTLPGSVLPTGSGAPGYGNGWRAWVLD